MMGGHMKKILVGLAALALCAAVAPAKAAIVFDSNPANMVFDPVTCTVGCTVQNNQTTLTPLSNGYTVDYRYTVTATSMFPVYGQWVASRPFTVSGGPENTTINITGETQVTKSAGTLGQFQVNGCAAPDCVSFHPISGVNYNGNASTIDFTWDETKPITLTDGLNLLLENSLGGPWTAGASGGTLDFHSTYTVTLGSPAVVPLPASVWLLGSGLLGLGLVGRRKRTDA